MDLRPQVRFALTSAAILAVALTTYLLIPRKEVSQFRSPEIPEHTFVLFPEDGAIVSDPVPRFRWAQISPSSAYEFSLLNTSGVVIWSGDVRDTSLTLPATIVLQPGKTYLWRVETFLADRSLERSALHAFTFTPSE
jgi:hypothetical protein